MPVRSSFLGALCMCGAGASFAVIDATAKMLTVNHAVLLVVWWRFVAAFAFLGLFLLIYPRSGGIRTRVPLVQMVRSVLMASGTCLHFYCLSYVPLAVASAILMTIPLFTVLFAIPVLGERVGWRRFSAVMVGMGGVLLIIRPGFGGFHWAMLLSLLGAMCLAGYQTYSALAARAGDDDITQQVYPNALASVVLTVLLLSSIVWNDMASPLRAVWGMSWLDGVSFAVCGTFGFFGHVLLVRSYRLAPASVVAPFAYTHVVWAIVLGVFLFGFIPDMVTFLGVGLVVSAGFWVIARERHRRGSSGAPKTSGGGPKAVAP